MLSRSFIRTSQKFPLSCRHISVYEALQLMTKYQLRKLSYGIISDRSDQILSRFQNHRDYDHIQLGQKSVLLYSCRDFSTYHKDKMIVNDKSTCDQNSGCDPLMKGSGQVESVAYDHVTNSTGKNPNDDTNDLGKISYVNLSPFGRSLLSVSAALMAFVNPNRADMVAAFGETSGDMALKRIQSRMRQSDQGRRLLQTKPRISRYSFGSRWVQFSDEYKSFFSSPSSSAPLSFGAAYVHFMESHQYSPDGRPIVKFIKDPELAYIMQRYREVHDFWHVLTGLPTTVLGEIGQKWFEAIQTGLPIAVISSVVGPLRLPFEEQMFLVTEIIPWAVRCGRSCPDLLSIEYERYYDQPLEELRVKWGFLPVPVNLPSQ